MPGSGVQRVRRQILREAEGYLDLALLFGDVWPLSERSRNRLAERAMDLLDRLGDAAQKGHAQYLRGQALRTLERYEEAIGPLKRASEDEPSDIHIWLALGWCYKRTGRLDLAIQALQEALEVDPTKAIIHYNLACYFSLAKNKAQALDYLSQALTMDKEYLNLIGSEHDFDPIRNDPGFQALTSVIV